MPKTNKKTIVILDAHAIIHRAYHALPNFTRSDGVPTGALYGLSSMLIRLIEEFHPDYLVAAYDLPKPTFRHHAYEAYKAGRAKTDEDLVQQLQRSREIFTAFGIPCLDAEGFEADDVIGTLVEQLKKEKGLSIVIASGDMDTLQLVDGTRVQVYTLKKGVTDTVMYDEAAVKERYDIEPNQLIDYKGLRGDPSDNIIGVPGIGEKTAVVLIKAFGTIEELFAAIEKDEAKAKKKGISDRILALLKEHKDDALFSKTLATIRRDAPISYRLPTDDHIQALDTAALLAMMQEYEFRSLVPRARKLFSLPDAPAVPVDPALLRETSVALWVLYSENTTPTLDDILSYTKQTTLAGAREIIMERLAAQGLLPIFEKIELPLIPIIKKMCAAGIGIDRGHFESLRERMRKELARIEEEVAAAAGERINLNSPKQLSELLFDRLKLAAKGKRKASGAFTTNAESLEALRDAHPAISLVLEYRETQKILTTYVEALLAHVKEDGRVHADFFQHGTTTGRFSSSNPNLQNIPTKGELGKEVRHGFVAAAGATFLAFDYSQIELRVLAILSGDERLIETFKKGEDIHASVAASMFSVPMASVTQEMRRVAKVINFGILFGMGVTALAKNLGTGRVEAQTFYTNYFERFPKVTAYLEASKEKARRDGYTETLFGRRRYFPGINSGPPHLRAFAERMASNAPIQGTEADILKIATLLVDTDLIAAGLDGKVRLVLQVHDELVYEAEEDVADQAKAIIGSAMTAVFERSPIGIPTPPVPITVSSGAAQRLDGLK